MVVNAAAHIVHPALPVDDAYISFAYARNLADGHGLVLTPLAEPVEAFSNFLWVVALALFTRLGVTTPTAGLLLCLAASVALIPATWWLVRRLVPQASPWWGVAAAAVVAVLPSTAFYAVAGLETPLYGLLLVAACGLFAHPAREPTRAQAAACLALALLRPEGALLWAALALTTFDRHEWRRARAWRWVAAVAVPLIAFMLFRALYFGSLVPNSVLAKSLGGVRAAFLHGRDAVANGLWPLVPLVPLLAVGAVRVKRPALGILACAAVITGGSLFLTGSTGAYPYARYLVPMVPPLVALAAAGAAEVAAAAPRRVRPIVGFVAVGLLLVVVPRQFDLGSFTTAGQLHALPTKDATLAPFVRQDRDPHPGVGYPAYFDVASLLRKIGEPGQLVALQEIGVVAYYSRLEVLDTFGLGDATIARTPGHPNGRTNLDYVHARRPDFWIIRMGDDDCRCGAALIADEAYLRSEAFVTGYDLVSYEPAGRAQVAVFRRRDGLLSSTPLTNLAPERSAGRALMPQPFLDGYREGPLSPIDPIAARYFYGANAPGFLWQGDGSPVSTTEVPLMVPTGNRLSLVVGVGVPPAPVSGRWTVTVVPEMAPATTIIDEHVDLRGPWRPRELSADLSSWTGDDIVLRFDFRADDGCATPGVCEPGAWLVWAYPEMLTFED